MSLHQIANHVQSAGRGDDKILVHMTPGEVKGLQAIAMSHGGSLTINPETGLPEAGFLKTILPMVAGFALGPAGFGIAQSALGAGAMVGGATALATGSLSKGLMAGFGAYGGFGIGEGLAAAGANAMGNAGANAAAGSVDDIAASAAKFKSNATAGNLENFVGTGKNAAANATTNAATSSGLQGYQGYNNIFSNPTLPVPASNLPTYTGAVAQPPISGIASTPLDVTIGSKVPPMPTAPVVDASKFNPNAYNAPVNQITSSSAPPSYMDKVGAGFRDVTSSGDKAWQFVKSNPAPFITAGIGLASDLMGSKSGTGAPASGPSYLRPYEFSTEQDPNAYLASDSTAERRYFKEPRYTALPIQRVASGGLLGMAEGGRTTANTLALPDRPPMEQVAIEQSIGQNMSFPMANQRQPAYSSSINRPQMHEVIDPSGGPEVDPYTGAPTFAGGGSALAVANKAEPTTGKKVFTAPLAGLGYTGTGNGGGGFSMGLMPPTTTTEVSGGMMPPAGQQAQPQMQAANPMMPNINVPEYQTPEQQLGLEGFYGMMDAQLAKKGAELQGMARGGIAGNSHLGGYSDGGRLLRGPGDGVSDSIPAVIGRRQPARLADGEFVVPARIVSEIGNGSTEAGARKLYAMMDRVQKARKKSVGKGKVAVNSKSERFLPA